MDKEEKNAVEAEEPEVLEGELLPDDEQDADQPQAASPEVAAADQLAALNEQLAALNSRYMLLYSDFENYRKHTAREKNDLLLNGSREMVKSVLPVIDDFERALAANGEDEGVRLIYSKLMKILEQKGLKTMKAVGEKFDDSLHEAVTRIPAADPEQKGTVVDVVEKGYYFNDKVLRYAKVVVAC